MDKSLRDALIKLLDAMPDGGTSGTFQRGDTKHNYSVSALICGGQWQIWATAYPCETLPMVMDDEKLAE